MVTKTIPKKKKCKKVKWLSGEALHITEKRREANIKRNKGKSYCARNEDKREQPCWKPEISGRRYLEWGWREE